jgi:hypothetical protein
MPADDPKASGSNRALVVVVILHWHLAYPVVEQRLRSLAKTRERSADPWIETTLVEM